MLPPAGGRRDAAHPHVQLALVGQLAKRWQHVRLTTGAAERRQAHAVQVFHHQPCAGLDVGAGGRRELRDQLAEAGFEDAARGLAGGVLHDRGILGRCLVDAEHLQRAAVEERFAIRRLEEHRVIGRRLIQFLARERLPVVGKLFDRPAAERVDPLALGRRGRPRTQQVEGVLARLDAVQAHLVLPGGARPQQVHMVVDQPGRDRAAPQVDPPCVRHRPAA